MLYPLKLKPALKDYLWGGTRLKTEYNKVSDLTKVAESWELSCHKDGQSRIVNGSHAGRTLTEYLETEGNEVLGSRSAEFTYFPLLIKLIDAADNLSVQVHPDNAYALKAEGEYGKTEMWYIVDCEPGAFLLYGFKEEISKAEFKERIENNTLLDVCNRVPVKKGDVFFIAAGTLHAIGKGIVIAEIQQNSNTTYRIYDYGRVGADGKPRQLHVEKALDVTSLTKPKKSAAALQAMDFFAGYEMKLLASCEFFTVYHFTLKDEIALTATKASFQSILALSGSLSLESKAETLKLTKGDSVFIPAGMGKYTVRGTGEFILSMV